VDEMKTKVKDPAVTEYERLSSGNAAVNTNNGGATMVAVMATSPDAVDVSTLNLCGMVVCDEAGRFEAVVMARPRKDVYRMQVSKFQGAKAEFEMVSSVAEALRFGTR
jgi:hypothetical protein